jgi:hypothetical protein
MILSVVSFRSLGFTPPCFAQFCFTSLAGQKTNTPPTLLSVACQSQAWSSVSKPNTRNAILDFNTGTQEMIEPQKGKKTLRKILMLDKFFKRDKFLLRNKKNRLI